MSRMDLNYSTLTSEELSEIDTLIIQIYRQITTSQYVKDMKYSELVHYTKQKITKIIQIKDRTNKLKAVLYFTNGLLSLSQKFDTYESFKNRFERFLTIFLKQQLPLIENWLESNGHTEMSESKLLDVFLQEVQSILHGPPFIILKDLILKIKYNEWQTWLQNPTLEGYKKIQANYSESQQQHSLQYILPLLQEHLYSPSIQRTYLNILSYESLSAEIIEYMLRYEHQPLQLNDEKRSILVQIEKNNKESLLPVYHQFIVRLIEKRTRAHYEEAVQYMKKLQKIYHTMNETDVFSEYVKKMNVNYKSYRALIQEMKKLDPIVQSK